ncbi:MAG: ROK family transcriptional regulator [Rhodobacteraceae bacterium]|nr:ROK family transcriptional regulator [Paracoccaceae bacterium]
MGKEQIDHGRYLILDFIRRSGQVARIDIANQCNISQATVTTITAKLLKAGLIEEIARDTTEKEARRGRPRVDLKLRNAAHMVAGVKVENNSVSVILADFEGKQLCKLRQGLADTVSSANDLASEIYTAINTLCENNNYSMQDLSATGVGIAGFVDASSGVIHWSPSIEQRNIDFGAILQARLGMPVYLDNDANLAAMAEQYFWHGVDTPNFLVVTIESGVGIGIVMDGKVYRGSRGFGAEFGHTKVQLEGALCRCGQRGCLEAYISDYALVLEAKVAGLPLAGNTQEEQVQALFAAAQSQEPISLSIISKARRMLAMGLANLVNIFDPQLIVLVGSQMQEGHVYSEDMIETVKNSIVQINASAPQFVVHKSGDALWAHGAAVYALEKVAQQTLRGL